jgi:transposase
MREKLRYVGLDVHADSIAVVAVAHEKEDPRFLGVVANSAESVRKLIMRLGRIDKLRVCYEAGQCGYVLYWQLQQMGVHCSVIAPSWSRFWYRAKNKGSP